MSSTDLAAASMREAIDQVEEAYEFMLAYAAQGRQAEAQTEGASAIRGYLERFRAALDTFGTHTNELMPAGSPEEGFARHFIQDTTTMKSVIDLLTASDSITSDMIDNTNGMIVVRSFLTDLFFIDQVLIAKAVSA